ncbi:MAG: ABC transporter permease subunit [Neomegalonema sp.]|nr:ABC transporter permease subunit [Neomegalonema sp.]
MAAFEGASARWARRIIIGVPYVWLAAFFLTPFLIVLKLSLSDATRTKPPYQPQGPDFPADESGWGLLSLPWRLLEYLGSWLSGGWAFLAALDFENFVWLAEDSLYINAYANSLWIAGVSTVLTLLIGYPLALAMTRAPEKWRPVLMLLVILPFWTSFLIRVYAWIGILKPEGLLNLALMSLGLISEPLEIYNTPTAVYIGIVYSYLPFMVLPLYATLSKLDPALLEASADLGAKPLTSFWRITLPLSLPGILAGSFLVFIPATGEFVIPDLLGGKTLMIGKVLYSEFFNNLDWPLASAVAVLLLLLLVGPIVLFQRYGAKQEALG